MTMSLDFDGLYVSSTMVERARYPQEYDKRTELLWRFYPDGTTLGLEFDAERGNLRSKARSFKKNKFKRDEICRYICEGDKITIVIVASNQVLYSGTCDDFDYDDKVDRLDLYRPGGKYMLTCRFERVDLPRD